MAIDFQVDFQPEAPALDFQLDFQPEAPALDFQLDFQPEDNGEIRKPQGQFPQLFKGTARALQKPNILSPIEVPFSLAGDVWRDVTAFGKTAIEQPLADQSMSFGGRYIKNLQDPRTIGEELGTKRAEELVNEGVPADRAALMAGIQGASLDIASFVGGGGPRAVAGIVRGIPGAVRSGAQLIKGFRAPKPAFEDILARAEQALPDFEQWMGRPEAPISAPDVTRQHVMFPPQSAGKMGPQIFNVPPQNPDRWAKHGQVERWKQRNVAQQELPFPVAGGRQLVPVDAPPPRVPKQPAPDQQQFPFMQEQPIALPANRITPEPLSVQEQMRRDFGQFFDPAERIGLPKQEPQAAFDFTKEASWAQEPAKPASLQDLIAGYTAKGIKPSAAQRMAEADLGMQPSVASPAQPKPTGKPLFDRWNDDTLELVNSIAAKTTGREQEKLLKIVYAADNAVLEGDLPKAVDNLEALRGRLDDESFDILDEIVNKYKGSKEPLVVPKNAIDDLPDEIAAERAARTKTTRDIIREAGRDAKKLRKTLNPEQALSDIVDIMGGEGLGLSTKTPLQLAKAEAARKRWKEEHLPAILELMKTTGMNAAEAVKSRYPHLSDVDVQALATRVKVGNLYIDKMSPTMQQTTMENKAAVKRPVITDKEVQKALGSADVQSEMMRIAETDPKLFAAAGRQAENMAEQMMRLAKNNPTQAEKYRTEAVDYLWRLSKIRHTAGLMLRHAGQKKASEDFIMMLEEGIKNGEFTGADAELIDKIIRDARKMHPKLLKSINNGIQEYGINMMLYNTETMMRNVFGQAIGTVLNPIERAANAGMTALARPAVEGVAKGVNVARAGVSKVRGLIGKSKLAPVSEKPEAYLKNITEAQEVLPSIGAGLKAVPGAVRSGIKMFVHETPKGIAESYARQAKGIRRAVSEGKITREVAKERIAKLQQKKTKLQEDFQLQEDMSSLGFSTDRALRSRNPVLDIVGKTINVGTRALKATDLANSQIIKAMETTAAHVRKQVQMQRTGERGKVKLSAADRNQILENTLHYSIRQHLPKQVSGVYKAINSNFVTGLTLPFVRAQVALPRFAGQRSPIAAGSIASNLVGTLRGKEQFDVMQLTRAVTGTAMAYGAWAALKNQGVEIHGAAFDPKEQTRRKASKIPMGVHLKFKDGSRKGVGDIAPVSYVFGALAAIDQMYRNREKGMSTDESVVKAGAEAMQNIGSGTIFTSARDLVKATEQGFKEAGDGGRKVYPGVNEGERLDRSVWQNWWQRKLVSTTTPRILAQAQREGWAQPKDMTYRSPRDLGEEYKNAIGFGLQKSVPQQKNIFGQSMERPENQGPMDEVFGLGDKGNQDPAIALFNRVNWYPEPPAKTQDGLRVSNDKRMAMLEKIGPQVHKVATRLANSENFARLPVRQQRDFLKEVVGELFSIGGEINKVKSLKQVQGMSPEQKRALQFELQDASTDVVAGWGLNPTK